MRKIGVVSMVYNGEQFLRQALESMLFQTYPHWTLVITDDGSTDSTPEILREYADQDDRIVVLRQEHSGVVDAFNNSLRFLLENTDVDYVARLDADDYFLPYALISLLNHIMETGVEVVHADQIEITLHKGEWYVSGISSTPVEQPTPGQLIRWLNVICGGSVLIRRSFLERIPSVHGQPDPYWDAELEGGWDVEWYIRMLIAGGRFRKLDKPVYVHRIHEGSMFAESVKADEEKEARWIRWRRQIWERRKIYRQLRWSC